MKERRSIAHTRKFSEAWDAFTRELDLRELDIDPDEVFADVRHDTGGVSSSRRAPSPRRAGRGSAKRG